MASFLMEDFVGNGVLRDQMDGLVADGWDDVPTLKMMTAEDMETLQLSQLQRDALEIRTYLHDRNLMEYADNLEASGKTLAELLHTNSTDLSTEYHMKRGHVARFLDRGSACGIQLPKDLTLPARKITAVHHGLDTEDSKGANVESVQPFNPEQEIGKPKAEPARSDLDMVYPGMKLVTSTDGGSTIIDHSGFKAPVVLRPVGGQPPASKGMFSAPAVQPRLCGLVRPGGIKEEVTPLPLLDKIMVQKLTDAHSKGNNPFKKKGPISIPAPSRASDLWADKPTLILCLRRPGCVMCRAEAHQLYARKPIFDAMGIQLVVCLNEHIDAEVRAFWPRYWGGIMVVDENRDFFKALGQGQLPKEGFITGFLLNSVARANYKRAQDTGIEGNLKGEGTIKGGLYIMRPGNGGVAYQFVERNFGDWAPLEEVLDVCGNIQEKEEEQEIEVPESGDGLEEMLLKAATPDKTVIITTLNQAWAANNTMIDVFLDRFHRGEGTKPLLNHLVIVALDQISYDRCKQLDHHCFILITEGVDFAGSKQFMSKDFLKMMWRRMNLLTRILELGYNFVFTDADIIWFRNPFNQFAKNMDFQISCDRFKGPVVESNKPNCGYQYTCSNKRTIAMYQQWCKGGEDNPNIGEQSLLNVMLKRKDLAKFGVKYRYLDTDQFSGFCQKSKDMTKVVTMHANCCTGLGNKIQDLRRALDSWERNKSTPPPEEFVDMWRVPAACRHSEWPSPAGRPPKPSGR